MKRSLKTIILITFAAVAFVLVLVIRHNVVSKNTYSLAKYTVVNVTGVDGRGKATVALDEVGLYAALAGDNASGDEKNKYFNFVSSIRVNLDRTEELSNGDELNVSVTYSEKEAEKLNLTIDKLERTQKVNGLIEGTKIDLFADIKFVISGISPWVSVTYSNESKNTYIKSLTYEISKTTGLAMGDTITITCNADENSAVAQGYFYDTNTKEFTIPKVDSYLTDATEIPQTIIDELISEDIAAIEEATKDKTYHMSYKATNNQGYLYRDNNEDAVNFAFDHIVVAHNSTDNELDNENHILLLYKGQIRMPNFNGTADPYDYLDVYFCFLYNDAIITADGEFLMATNDPIERFVCGANYDDCMKEARDRVGAGYVYSE